MRAAAVADRLAKRLSRKPRGLSKTATVASAVTVAPVRYATLQGTAQQTIRTSCRNCPPGSRCCGGFTAFCCSLPGHDNFGCPAGMYIGGWWQCNYGGGGLCGTSNVRYYLDCNTRPGHACPGGCHCGADECSNFKTCCIHFRYGQCNTQIGQVGTIMCRLVTCVIPCAIECTNCSCSAAFDQLTCTHDNGCL